MEECFEFMEIITKFILNNEVIKFSFKKLYKKKIVFLKYKLLVKKNTPLSSINRKLILEINKAKQCKKKTIIMIIKKRKIYL